MFWRWLICCFYLNSSEHFPATSQLEATELDGVTCGHRCMCRGRTCTVSSRRNRSLELRNTSYAGLTGRRWCSVESCTPMAKRSPSELVRFELRLRHLTPSGSEPRSALDAIHPVIAIASVVVIALGRHLGR